MNFDGSFNEIGRVDIQALRELALGVSENDWALDVPGRSRNSANPGLQSVALVFDPDLRYSHPTRLPLLKTFEHDLKPALKRIADHFEKSAAGEALTRQYGLGYFIRATLERLRAGETATFPPETAFSQVHAHRVHLPVITGESATVTIGGETRHLGAGHLVELNNRRDRTEVNPGGEDRIHVVLDFVLRGERCCCGARRHPGTVCSPRACRETDQLEIACSCFAR